jgi:paraquat-inducible protein B
MTTPERPTRADTLECSVQPEDDAQTPLAPGATSSGGSSGSEALPTARLVQRERLSLVWLLPVLAALVGGWLLFKALSERGPTVTITFPSASGLQAGKTKVKFKDVDIGTVTDIDVSPDLSQVIVVAELRHGSDHFLAEDTQFWVARPRITVSQITGLETLLSGAYVAVSPGDGEPGRRDFEGLSDPPVISTDEPGRRFRLRSDALGSLNLGSPVYYRSIRVGQVTNFKLDEDGGAVTVEIFVNAPHDRLVHTNTRFWNASGVDVSLSADGVSIDTESLVSVLIGGVGFETPDDLGATEDPAPADHFFPLYASRSAANAPVYLNKERFLMIFSGSVRGLSVGAPVSLRGIEIGRVLDVQLKFDDETLEFFIPVLVEVEPERIGILGRSEQVEGRHAAILHQLVQAGLRAQLKPGNLLTGSLYIELDFHEDAPPVAALERDGYRLLPTLPTPLEEVTGKATQILDQVTQILDKVNALPIEEIGIDVRAAAAGVRSVADSDDVARALSELADALGEARKLMADTNARLVPEIDGALATLGRVLEEAAGTLANANALIAPDAPLSAEAVRTMREVSAAARSIRAMADYLERHPEALIQGKGGMR